MGKQPLYPHVPRGRRIAEKSLSAEYRAGGNLYRVWQDQRPGTSGLYSIEYHELGDPLGDKWYAVSTGLSTPNEAFGRIKEHSGDPNPQGIDEKRVDVDLVSGFHRDRPGIKETTERNQQIAQTILLQLGGNRLKVMTGASNFTAIDSGLMFSLPSNFAKQGINKVRIILSPNDTYKVEFWKIGRAPAFSQTIMASHEDIYEDRLAELVSQETGLDLHL